MVDCNENLEGGVRELLYSFHRPRETKEVSVFPFSLVPKKERKKRRKKKKTTEGAGKREKKKNQE